VLFLFFFFVCNCRWVAGAGEATCHPKLQALLLLLLLLLECRQWLLLAGKLLLFQLGDPLPLCIIRTITSSRRSATSTTSSSRSSGSTISSSSSTAVAAATGLGGRSSYGLVLWLQDL
jgi:hypothetical protein